MPGQTVKTQIPSECEWGSFTFIVFMKKFKEFLERLDEKDFIEVKGGFVDLDIG